MVAATTAAVQVTLEGEALAGVERALAYFISDPNARRHRLGSDGGCMFCAGDEGERGHDPDCPIEGMILALDRIEEARGAAGDGFPRRAYLLTDDQAKAAYYYLWRETTCSLPTVDYGDLHQNADGAWRALRAQREGYGL